MILSRLLVQLQLLGIGHGVVLAAILSSHYLFSMQLLGFGSLALGSFSCYELIAWF